MSTILVVDDAAASREPVAQLLRRHGYEVIRAATGRDALELLDSDTIHLVLLDLIMPEMDGMEFLRILRKDRRHSGLPVIVLTGQSDEAIVQQVRKFGVRDCLVKSRFSVQSLLGHVERILRLDEAQQEDTAMELDYLGIV